MFGRSRPGVPSWVRYSMTDHASPSERFAVSGYEIAEWLASTADKPPRGTLFITDVFVTSDLTIAGLALNAGLIFYRCEFSGFIDAFGLSARNLGFIDCRVAGGFDGRDLKLDLHFTFRHGSVCLGPVLLRDSVIGGYVDCTAASFLFDPDLPAPAMPPLLVAQHDGQAFGCSRLRAQTLLWQDVEIGPGKASFKNASVAILRDDIETRGTRSWPPSGRVDLLWFSYETKSPASYDRHLAWLKLDDEAVVPGTRTLVTFLERSGDIEQAHRLLLWARGQRADGLEVALDRRARRAYLQIVRLSFDLRGILRRLGWLFVVTWAACAVMWWVEWIGPDDLRTVTSKCFRIKAACSESGWMYSPTLFATYRTPTGYPAFSASGYSLGLLLPYLTGLGKSGWAPANAIAGLALGACRGAALVLQAMLFWNVVGRRELR